MNSRTVRTTLALPGDVLDRVDQAVREGRARSRNAFVTLALRRELAAQEREAIDTAFASMADDGEAQEEALQLAQEFARADWGAWREADSSWVTGGATVSAKS